MALATGFILAHMAIADELLPPASLNVTDDGPLFCPTRATRDGGFRVLTVDLNPARIDPLQVHEVVVDSERSKVYVSLHDEPALRARARAERRALAGGSPVDVQHQRVGTAQHRTERLPPGRAVGLDAVRNPENYYR